MKITTIILLLLTTMSGFVSAFANITIEPAFGAVTTRSATPPSCACPSVKPAVGKAPTDKRDSRQSDMPEVPINLDFKQ